MVVMTMLLMMLAIIMQNTHHNNAAYPGHKEKDLTVPEQGREYHPPFNSTVRAHHPHHPSMIFHG